MSHVLSNRLSLPALILFILLVAMHSGLAGCDKRDKTAPDASMPQKTSPDATVAKSANSSPSQAAATIPFPPRPVPTAGFGPNIEFYDIHLAGSRPGLPMQINVYLPKGQHNVQSLPCIFIAPAGSAMHGGMIDPTDRPEHLPYVVAGYAVVAYELSGTLERTPGKEPTEQQIINSITGFMAADGGLINGKYAIDYTLARFPEIDPKHLFACGHSSAAVVALNLARGDTRIAACCAYAPPSDVEAWWPVADIDPAVPGFAAFAKAKSPVRHIADFHCPIYLFHADDDKAVALSDNVKFAKAMEAAGKPITFDRITTGDHYQSMIRQGIPGGMRFMEHLGAKPHPAKP